jgi:hypothetical protein
MRSNIDPEAELAAKFRKMYPSFCSSLGAMLEEIAIPAQDTARGILGRVKDWTIQRCASDSDFPQNSMRTSPMEAQICERIMDEVTKERASRDETLAFIFYTKCGLAPHTAAGWLYCSHG